MKLEFLETNTIKKNNFRSNFAGKRNWAPLINQNLSQGMVLSLGEGHMPRDIPISWVENGEIN